MAFLFGLSLSTFTERKLHSPLMQNWNEWVLNYYEDVTRNWGTHPPVEPLMPYMENECKKIRTQFYNKYYNDTDQRQLWLGINPGRHGAGITGIPFSDPVHIQQQCGLENTWDKKKELSAEFIFEVINAYGGPKSFYKKVFIDSICPVGFTKEGLNFNYYDEKDFFTRIKPRLESHLNEFEEQPLEHTVVIIGKGKNEKHFKKLKTPFEHYITLPHPRWVMQYRRKEKEKWIDAYLKVLHK